MSGSMEPRIHVGDIVVTRDRARRELTKGQVITVKDPDHPAKTRTHRVLRRDADGTIVTQGRRQPRRPTRAHVSDDDVLGRRRRPGPLRRVARRTGWPSSNWLALGATSLFLGWCLVTVLPRIPQARGRPTATTGSGRPVGPAATRVRAAPPPPSLSPRWPWALATGPAEAAFTQVGRRTRLDAGRCRDHVLPLPHGGARRLAVLLLAPGRDQRHGDRRRRAAAPATAP